VVLFGRYPTGSQFLSNLRCPRYLELVGSMIPSGFSRLNRHTLCCARYFSSSSSTSCGSRAKVLVKVWKSWAPFKVIVFSSQLLRNRILTFQNLFTHNVIRDPLNTLCILSPDEFGAPRVFFSEGWFCSASASIQQYVPLDFWFFG
jgi:hypothetical protein